MESKKVIRTYLWITALTTLSQSLIWGINTLFLLAAGMNIFQVMIINASYTAGQLIANNATAGSITVPSFAIATSAGAAAIPRLRLSVNDTTSTSWGTVQIQVDLWSAAPTWTNGDHAAWLPATGWSWGHRSKTATPLRLMGIKPTMQALTPGRRMFSLGPERHGIKPII